MKVSYLAGMNVSASGLNLERTIMNTVAENLANAQTTKTETGDPYRRKIVEVSSTRSTFPTTSELSSQGLDLVRTDPGHLTPAQPEVQEPLEATTVQGTVVEDPSEFPQIYDPGHPDADANGMVRMPNVETTREMVTLLAASRAYEANVAALQASRKLSDSALNLAR